MDRRSFLQFGVATPAIYLPHLQGGSSDLAALLAAAKVSGNRRLYLPAGDYVLPGGLLLDVAGLEIVGDGIGKTRLICDGLAISGLSQLLTLNADRIKLSHFSILIANTTGIGQLKAVAADWNCTRPHLQWIEVVGGYGTNNAGGAAFDFYRPGGGNQYAVVEDCIARDASLATGFIVNSNANVFSRCEARDSGALPGQHGFYIQGGYSHFNDCRVERVQGYSYNATCNVSNQDGSGNVFSGCTSIDPGGLHFVSDGYTYAADGGNPDVPAGAMVGRGVLIQDCTFRRSKNGPASGGVYIGKNGTIQGCYFEDAVGGDLAQWLTLRDGSSAIGNVFVGTNHPAAVTSVQQGIVTTNDCTVVGNRMHGGQRMMGMKLGPRTVASGNMIAFPATNTHSGIAVNGANVTLRDNRIVVGGGLPIQAGIWPGLVMENNY